MKKIYLLIPVVIVMLVMGSYFLGASFQDRTSRPMDMASTMVVKPLVPKSPRSLNAIVVKKNQLEVFLEGESLKIGRIDGEPERTKERLSLKAKSLSFIDLNQLSQIAMDRSKTGDQRFLAVYLLTESSSSKAIPLLYQISSSDLNKNSNERAFDEEVVLRLQALKGIEALSSPLQKKEILQKYLSKQNNSFLSEQAKSILRL